MAFTSTEETPQEVAIRLRPAGAEWGQEYPIEIINARVLSPVGQEARVQDGAVHFTLQPNDRVMVEIETSDILNDFAFRIG